MSISLASLFIAGLAVVSAAPPPDTGFIGRGTNLLSTTMLQLRQSNDSNYVFSPLGYSTLLAVLAEGGVGPTRDQIAKALELPEDSYTVRTAYRALLAPMQERGVPNQPEFKNWFYLKKNVTIEDGYKAILEENYYTEVKEINNSLKSPEVNETSQETETTTAKEQTNERMEGAKAVEREIIQSLHSNGLEEIPPSKKGEKELKSKAICFNALFFNGMWADSFSEVEGCNFQTPSGPVKVNCAESTGNFRMARLEQLKAEVLQLPYQGGRYVLDIILPEKDQSLEDVTSKLTSLDLSTIDKKLVNRTMKICLPKFKFYTISRPKGALNKHGVEDVYSAAMADLSTITGSKQLYLADLVQYVSIEVNEKSASYNHLTATSIASLRTAIPEFHVNRPFLFFLRDKIENYTVVAGKLENPNSET
ncbi:leukocyte elastase inhibitor C [Halyomorpha halys]|uniref:leukocyte elastase inhibitor C n=1 Tax=Halyomorpha halys TaxID=286706 RepID=UPI0006D4E0A2|nr:leukocyte elastase inhibitor C [Halyomorpha halys]